jgi:hypothetical protein
MASCLPTFGGPTFHKRGMASVRLPGQEHETMRVFGSIECCPPREWLTIKGYWEAPGLWSMATLIIIIIINLKNT